MHAFSAAGTYTVTLTASIDGGCSSTFSQEVTVLEGEDIEYTIQEDFICGFPTDVGFEVLNTNAESYSWQLLQDNEVQWEGENESIVFNNMVTVVEEGDFDLLLEVELANGCTVTLIDEALFNVDSIVLYMTIGPTGICEGETVFGNDFTEFVTPFTEITYDWGDGNFSFEQMASNTYPDSGSYTVNYSVLTAEGCSADTTVEIQVGTPSFPSQYQ